MFSSSHSVNPFQHPPSPFHHSPPFVGHYSDDIFSHHHNDLPVGHFPPANAYLAEALINMAVSNNPTMTRPDCYAPSNFLPVKRAPKKDRHSKITTAKGPRERRVRLSIKIARKFFDLQDMLGFDKASRTLEWLLMKSKTAIKEVVRMKHICNDEGAKSASSDSECEVMSKMNDAFDSGDPREILFRRTKSPRGVPKEKKMKESSKAAFHLLARESRAKARARARERTREKMFIKRFDELRKFPDANHHFLGQLRSSCQFQTHDKLGASNTHNMTSSLKLVAQVEDSSSRPLPNNTQRGDIIEESIVIKRKLKPPPAFACPQNLLFSKDLNLSSSHSHSNSNFPHPPQNWDINTPSTRSNGFCAMANMNLSSEFQMFGNPGRLTTISVNGKEKK